MPTTIYPNCPCCSSSSSSSRSSGSCDGPCCNLPSSVTSLTVSSHGTFNGNTYNGGGTFNGAPNSWSAGTSMSLCSEFGYTYLLACVAGVWTITLTDSNGNIGIVGLNLISCCPLLLTGVFGYCNLTVTE